MKNLHSEMTNTLENSSIENLKLTEPKGIVETTLTPVLSEMPWNTTFSLCAGVDVVTGNGMSTGVNPIDVKPSTLLGISSDEIFFIETKKDLEKLFKITVGGKFNVSADSSLSGDASYSNTVKFSSVATTLVVHYSASYQGYDEPVNQNLFTLTDQAKKLMEDDPEKFRASYGDYYISGIKRARQCTILYVCTTESETSMTSFKAKAKAQFGKEFDAKAAAEFSKIVSENRISIEVHNYMNGLEDKEKCPENAPWSMESAFNALAWYKVNAIGNNAFTKLRHYNTLNANYPLTIPIDPTVFTTMSGLYQDAWYIISMFNSCPEIYQEKLKSRVNSFKTGLFANKAILATDNEKLDFFSKEANSLKQKLESILNKQAFYYLIQKPSNEPGIGNHQSANERRHWSYGLTESSGGSYDVQVLKWTDRIKRGKKSAGKHTVNSTFDKSRTGNKLPLIVGWEIKGERADNHNGGWEMNSQSFIGKDTAEVTVQSQFDRDLDWSFTVYYVWAEDFLFG